MLLGATRRSLISLAQSGAQKENNRHNKEQNGHEESLNVAIAFSVNAINCCFFVVFNVHELNQKLKKRNHTYMEMLIKKEERKRTKGRRKNFGQNLDRKKVLKNRRFKKTLNEKLCIFE